MTDLDLAGHARSLLERNRYLVLGTTGEDGQPWTSPVYFSAVGLREYYWVSQADALHSVNLATRPRVSIVVFDSGVAPYHGRAVYASGEAAELAGEDLDRGLGAYPGSDSRGAAPIEREDVTGSSPYRLYRAVASDLWVLCPREPRRPCALHGLAQDHRARVGNG
nr:pyridoxamine 5'-phosphate oxidase family protein [uncultured Actinoplanes sp.]